MENVYKIVIVLHVLSAVIWVGGVLFMGMIAVPAARRLNDKLRRHLLDDLGRRFRKVGWTALGVLIVTGLYLLWHWGARLDTVLDLSFFAHDHTRLLGYKILAVIAMLAISGVHDFWLGPKATRADRTPEEVKADRRMASLLGRATGILVIVIVILATFVARPWA